MVRADREICALTTKPSATRTMGGPMQRRDFELFVTSIREGGRIRAGTLLPASVTILKSPRLTSRESRETEFHYVPSKRPE